MVFRVDSDTVRSAELSRSVSRLSPRLNPVAFFVHLRDPRIDIAIADVRVARLVPCHVGYLAEQSIDGRQRRVRVRQRTCLLVRRLLLASENHGYTALGT